MIMKQHCCYSKEKAARALPYDLDLRLTHFEGRISRMPEERSGKYQEQLQTAGLYP
jgi:hypothetical protein